MYAVAKLSLDGAGLLSADVIIQELEDFTPPLRRPKARQLCSEVFEQWRETGALAAVRVNRLEMEGMADLVRSPKDRTDGLLNR